LACAQGTPATGGGTSSGAGAIAPRLELPEGFTEVLRSDTFGAPLDGEFRFALAAHENGLEIEAAVATYVPLRKEDFAQFVEHFNKTAPDTFRNLTIDASKPVVEHGTQLLVVLYRTNYGPHAGAMIFRSFAGKAMRVTLQGPSSMNPEVGVRTLDTLVKSVAKIEDPAA
jgi:hypothetical protein